MSRDTCPECADDLRDQMVSEIDAGLRCPQCNSSGYVAKVTMRTEPPFHCLICGARWKSWEA